MAKNKITIETPMTATQWLEIKNKFLDINIEILNKLNKVFIKEDEYSSEFELYNIIVEKHFMCNGETLTFKASGYISSIGEFDTYNLAINKFNKIRVQKFNNEQEKDEYETNMIFEEYKIPDEFRSTISSMAYDRGHSAGYEEVQMLIKSYCSDLSQPIKDYSLRLTGSYN